MRDFLESTMSLIEKHDISESEFWQAINYLQNGASEFGLIVPVLASNIFSIFIWIQRTRLQACLWHTADDRGAALRCRRTACRKAQTSPMTRRG